MIPCGWTGQVSPSAWAAGQGGGRASGRAALGGDCGAALAGPGHPACRSGPKVGPGNVVSAEMSRSRISCPGAFSGPRLARHCALSTRFKCLPGWHGGGRCRSMDGGGVHLLQQTTATAARRSSRGPRRARKKPRSRRARSNVWLRRKNARAGPNPRVFDAAPGRETVVWQPAGPSPGTHSARHGCRAGKALAGHCGRRLLMMGRGALRCAALHTAAGRGAL